MARARGSISKAEHWNMDQVIADPTLTLADGRHLAYRIYGPSHGPAAFYFHGWPGSRLEPSFFNFPNLRLIAVDRPGYGQSDKAPDRRLEDWPRDVAQLADHLGLEQFGVVGLSGGGPYAAACAHALQDRIPVCVLVSALGPPEAKGMSSTRLRALRSLGRRPRARSVMLGFARRVILSESGEKSIGRLRKLIRRQSKDLAALDPAFAGFLFQSWREAVGRSIEGMASDARIYDEPWPFRLDDLTLPVRLWHGDGDTVVPVSICHHYAARCPDAVPRIFEGEGHVSLIRTQFDAVIADLLRFLD